MLLLLPGTLFAQEDVEEVHISDNSFLIEEAFNQEQGVVQHIFNGFYAVDRQPGPDDQNVALSFTQEWPVPSQTHQLSYTLQGRSSTHPLIPRCGHRSSRRRRRGR